MASTSSYPPTDDVEGGTVGRDGDRERQAAEDGHGPLEAHQPHGNLPLIVIHGHDSVAVPKPGSTEDRVGGPGAVSIDGARPGLLDSRSDYLDLLTAEQPPLTSVGIQGCDRNPRAGNPGPFQGATHQLGRHSHRLQRDAG